MGLYTHAIFCLWSKSLFLGLTIQFSISHWLHKFVATPNRCHSCLNEIPWVWSFAWLLNTPDYMHIPTVGDIVRRPHKDCPREVYPTCQRLCYRQGRDLDLNTQFFFIKHMVYEGFWTNTNGALIIFLTTLDSLTNYPKFLFIFITW
jgi:hypothetical protein